MNYDELSNGIFGHIYPERQLTKDTAPDFVDCLLMLAEHVADCYAVHNAAQALNQPKQPAGKQTQQGT